MTELEKLQDYLDDIRADEEFLLAQERFLIGIKSSIIKEKEEKWNEERYYRDLNEKHKLSYGNYQQTNF